MSKTIIHKGDTGSPLLIYKNGGASAVMAIKHGSAKTTHLRAQPSAEETEAAKDWVPWGATDDFPEKIAKMIRKSTVGRAGLQRQTKYLYGQRTITYKVVDIDDSGREIIQMTQVPEWEEIKRRSNFNYLRLGQAQDYAYYGIAWVEMIFSADKQKVLSLHYHKASHVRFGAVNKKTGLWEYAYISGKFPNVEVKDCQRVRVIDPMLYPMQLDEIRADRTTFKYLMPLCWPDVLNDFYPVAFWDSARESGWLDIAISIPAYKKALFQNQMSIKYHVSIPIEYFRQRYPGWDRLTAQKQDDIITALYDEVNDMLTGAENAQKALVTFFETSRDGKAIGQWEITVIDDKTKNGAHLPDASAANSEILFSMGQNPAISGQGNTGGNYTGGSNNGGSNIRESGLDLRSQLRADRDILFMYFDFIKMYNGLDLDIELGVQDMVLTTLDTGKGSDKIVS